MELTETVLSVKDIDYTNGHGTAIIAGYIAESHATQNAKSNTIPFSTTKSYASHGFGAPTSIEALIGLEAMNENWFAPTLNLNELDSECASLDFIRDEARQIDTQYFMSNNFAFGGVNTSLIFARSQFSVKSKTCHFLSLDVKHITYTMCIKWFSYLAIAFCGLNVNAEELIDICTNELNQIEDKNGEHLDDILSSSFKLKKNVQVQEPMN